MLVRGTAFRLHTQDKLGIAGVAQPAYACSSPSSEGVTVCCRPFILQALKARCCMFGAMNTCLLHHCCCRVAATAVVYFRRLYAGSSFSAHDPHLVAPGCLYLASKVGS